MHEFSLAQGLHSQLIGLAREHQATKVVQAEVAIGSDAGIVVESFVFGFNVLAEYCELTKEMDLVIETVSGQDIILTRVQLE